MELRLRRLWLTKKSTCGELTLDGTVFSFTLELPVVDGRPGSAIPDGRYAVGLHRSPHFGRSVPLLENVPGRSEIEIHWGSYPCDTRGCILVGRTHPEDDFIGGSREAFADLFSRIAAAVTLSDGCFITVETPSALEGSVAFDPELGT